MLELASATYTKMATNRSYAVRRGNNNLIEAGKKNSFPLFKSRTMDTIPRHGTSYKNYFSFGGFGHPFALVGEALYQEVFVGCGTMRSTHAAKILLSFYFLSFLCFFCAWVVNNFSILSLFSIPIIL
jgi:hypothetical protein